MKDESKKGKIEEEKLEEKNTEKKSVDYFSKIRENPWIASTVVLGLALIIVLIFSQGDVTGGAVSSTDAGQSLIDFINSRGQGINAEIQSVEKDGSLYKVMVNIDGQTTPVFVTLDGKYAIAQPIPLTAEVIQDTQEQESTQSQKVVEVSIDDDAVKGNEKASVTIVEFSDYECPYCGKYFMQTSPQIISEYVDTGKVKLVFRDFPLGFHENAQKAAEAAECAGEQDKYWEMHDKLFNNQQALSVGDLKKYAGELKLNTVKFNSCLDSGKTADEVKADMAEGQSYGVSGTPAFFINGKMLSGAQPFSEFKKIIDEELAKA